MRRVRHISDRCRRSAFLAEEDDVLPVSHVFAVCVTEDVLNLSTVAPHDALDLVARVVHQSATDLFCRSAPVLAVWLVPGHGFPTLFVVLAALMAVATVCLALVRTDKRIA